MAVKIPRLVKVFSLIRGGPLHLVISGIVSDVKPQISAYIKLADWKGRFSQLWKPACGRCGGQGELPGWSSKNESTSANREPSKLL
jgi:hypothetical protein